MLPRFYLLLVRHPLLAILTGLAVGAAVFVSIVAVALWWPMSKDKNA